MEFQILYHTPLEGAASIGDWLQERGHSYQICHLHRPDEAIPAKARDGLIVMGGPMSIHEEQKFPWLRTEKKLIRDTVDRELPLLGICLGAQLIAEALGATVATAREQEIGWHPLFWEKLWTKHREGHGEKRREKTLRDHPLFAGIAEIPDMVLHWHGESFTLPENATPLASSAACRQQGFLYGPHILALQFHLEMREIHIRTLIEHLYKDVRPGPYVQSPEEILEQSRRYSGACQKLLCSLLDNWLKMAAPAAGSG